MGSPICLGVSPKVYNKKGEDKYFEVLTKSVITALRHGLVYYYLFTTKKPDSEGGYGPINHMFPITPVELHEGWIKGKERIITAISGEYLWENSCRPKVYLFNLRGKKIPAHYSIEKVQKEGWRVKLNLKDWEEIGIIE